MSSSVKIILGIASAISAVVIAYKQLNPIIKEQKKELDELKDKYTSVKDELSSLNEQIKENSKLIIELKNKYNDGTITLVEEDQLKKLRLQNNLLKAQIKLKEDDDKREAKKLSKKNIKTFMNEFGGSVDDSYIPNIMTEDVYAAKRFTYDNGKTTINEVISLMESNDKLLNQALLDGSKERIATLEEDKDNIIKELETRLSGLLEYQDTLMLLMNDDGSFDDLNNQQMWDMIEGWKKEINKRINNSGEWNTIQIETALDDESLTDIQNELLQKLKDGTLTKEDISGNLILNQALEKMNLILDNGQTPASIYLQYLKGIAKAGQEINTLEEPKIFKFEEVLTELEESYTTLHSLKEEVDEFDRISVNTIQDIMSKYPGLTDMLFDYVQGKKSEQDVINALSEEYETDLENYKLYIAQKSGEDEGFWNQIVDGLSEDLIDKADSYGIELENYSSYLEAKLIMDKEYALKKARMDNATKIYESSVTDTTHYVNPSLSAYDDMEEAKQEFTDIEEIIKAIDTAITAKVPDFNTDLFNDDPDIEEFSDSIDWSANSISNLNREIDNLRDKLESASLDEKKGIYAQLDEKNKELVEATKKAADKYEDVWKEKSASLSLADKEKIMSGEVFEIEKIKDPERYAKLTEGQQAYEQWKTSEQEYEKAKQQRKSDAQAAKQNEEDIYASKRNKRNNKISFFNSQIQDIDNEIALSEAKGGSATEVQYRRKNSFLNEQLGILYEDRDAAKAMRNTFDYGSDKWEEYNSQMQEAENNINENRIAQIENNKAILMLPVEQYEKLNEELQEELEKLEKEKEIIETAISSASNIVQGQIDYYNDLKEATTDYYDDEIEKIQEKKDALTENNDAIQKQIDLEKAQYELSRARNQKNIKVLRNGEFVYEADQDAIRTAQEELDNQVYNNAVDELDKQIEGLQNKKDEALNDIDLQIESLQDYKEQIDGIVSKYQEMLNLQSLMTTFGADIVQRIMAGDTSVIDEMTAKHVDKSVEIDKTKAEIDSNEADIKAIQNLVKEWETSQTKIEYAQAAIKKVTENNTTELQATKDRIDSVGGLAKGWSATELSIKEDLGLINTNHTTATEEEKTILDGRLSNIQSFASQARTELQSIQSTLAALQTAKAQLNEETNGATSIDINTAGKSHSGMELGYIGETSDNKDNFKYIALNKLKPDEVPRILQMGEAVLTKLQQANVMQNIQSAFVSGIKYNIPKNNIQPIQRTYNINGDIVLQNVNDVQTLAQSIKNTFLTRLDQELYK